LNALVLAFRLVSIHEVTGSLKASSGFLYTER